MILVRRMSAGDCAWVMTSTGGATGLSRQPERDAFELADCALAVAARADHRGIGPAIDPIERRIIRAVEEVLHQAAHRGQVLGRGEEVAVGAEHVVGLRVLRVEQHRADGGLRAAPRTAASAICRVPPVIEW